MAKKQTLELRDFQKRDVLFIRKNNYRVLVANAQGTGKTIECLAAISLDRKKLCPVIIVCPASVTLNWFRETRKWCRWARVHVIKNRKERMPKRRAHIYVVSWTLFAERIAEITTIKPRLLVADEAHFAKNPDAQRSQALYGLAKECPYLLLLTGTPLINSAHEIETLKNLFGIPNPPILRRLLTDVAKDIPDKTRALLPVYLPTRIGREYSKAANDFAHWLEVQLHQRMEAGEAKAAAHRALAAEALVKIGYLRRIVGRGKANAAVDFIARAVRMGEPIVVFAEHSRVLRTIAKKLRQQQIGYVAIKGSTPKSTRQNAVDRFQKGEVPVFLGSKAASTGITLTRARHMCFVEYYYTSAEMEQAEDRIRRIGQAYPTKIWMLHATGTIDDRIEEIIQRKRRLVRRIVGSEDIADTPEKTAHQIIAAWSRHSIAPVIKGRSLLGLVKALPPLPKPRETSQLVFKGKRWNQAAIKAWCKMNRYAYDNLEKYGKGYRIVLTKPSSFVDGSFEVVKIAKDIKIIKGTRRSSNRSRRITVANSRRPQPRRKRKLTQAEKLMGSGMVRWS